MQIIGLIDLHLPASCTVDVGVQVHLQPSQIRTRPPAYFARSESCQLIRFYAQSISFYTKAEVGLEAIPIEQARS